MEIKIAIEDYRTYLVIEKALSENSIEAYLNDIKNLSEYCNGEGIDTIEDVTNEVINAFLEDMKGSGMKTRTQARCISSINSFFRFLLLNGRLEENPIQIKAPKVEQKLPNVLTVEEVNSILKGIEMYKPEGQRTKAIIGLLYSCGLRVSEAINLKVSDIDFRRGNITVSGKKDKNRLVPLSGQVKEEIKLYMNSYRKYLDIAPGYEDVLFLSKRGATLSRIMVFNVIKHLAAKAGINKHISPHTFRHSFAYRLISSGTNIITVKNLLGHESIQTTEVYTHIIE